MWIKVSLSQYHNETRLIRAEDIASIYCEDYDSLIQMRSGELIEVASGEAQRIFELLLGQEPSAAEMPSEAGHKEEV